MKHTIFELCRIDDRTKERLRIDNQNVFYKKLVDAKKSAKNLAGYYGSDIAIVKIIHEEVDVVKR